MALLCGAAIVFSVYASAMRTLILPRGVAARLARVVFLAVRRFFDLRVGRLASYERTDGIMAMYGPTALFALLATYIVLIFLAYMLLFWGAVPRTIPELIELSGSSMFTLGYNRPGDLFSLMLSFSEAGIGLSLLALLITYLPSINAAFSRREAAVTALEVRAGTPPFGVEMLSRFHRLNREDHLHEEWEKWETWFVDVEETHLSFPVLAFFRSPQPDHSWVTAAGAVLDAAALYRSCVDAPVDTAADICIRAGYLCLQRIALFYRVPFKSDTAPSDPISVTREEFDEALAVLAGGGVKLKPDRDQCWRDFSGWRANYDKVLLPLAGLVLAPPAPWSSDRGQAGAR